jgi:hypothetical protein
MAENKKLFYRELFFTGDAIEKEMSGETWGDVIKNAEIPYAPLWIYTDDDVLHFPECEKEKSKGEIINICLDISGGGLKKVWDFISNPITLITAIVAVVLLFTPAQAIGVSMLIGLSIGAVGAAFMKVPDDDNQAKDNSPSKNKYGLTGGQNQSQMKASWPAVFGKTQVIPPYVANYYTEMDDRLSGDGEQYLYALLNFGYKPLEISNIKIGDTLVAVNDDNITNGTIYGNNSIPGVVMELRQDGTVPGLYGGGNPRKMSQISANVKREDGQKYIYTSPRGTNKIHFNFRFNGLVRMNDDGGYENASVRVNCFYRKSGTNDTWKLFVEGTNQYYLISKQTTSMGSEISQQKVIGNTFVISTNHGPIPGRYQNGKVQAQSWTYKGTDYWEDLYYTPAGDNGESGDRTFTKNKRDVLRYEIICAPTIDDINNNATGQWDVMVQRLTIDGRDRVTDSFYWDSCVWEIDGAVMAQDKLDESVLLAIKAEANEITNGIMNKISAIAQLVAPVYIAGDNPTYTATDWGNDGPTSNPAALYLKLLKGAYMHKQASDNVIDWEFLVKFYKFCESKNYKCNGVIANQERLGDILQKICATARTEFYIRNGCYSGVIDDIQPTPVAILTPKNTSGFGWSRKFGDKIAAYSCEYQNAEDAYNVVTEDIYGVGDIAADGDFKQQLEIWGVDNHTQIVKIARFMLANNLLRRNIYNLRLPVEHFALNKGNRTLLSHDVIAVGLSNGYISAYNSDTFTITVDEIIQPTDVDKSYGITIGNPSGAITVPCEQIETAQQTITLSQDPGIEIKAGDMYAFGEIGKITKDCIIITKEIGESPQLDAQLTLTDYAPEVFAAESLPIPPYISQTSNSVFNMAAITEGIPAETEEMNGSSVRDDGAVFFDFSPENYDSVDNKYKNYGNLKTVGDGTVDIGNITSTYSPEKGFYFAGASNNGRVAFGNDICLYKDFSISFWAKGDIPQSRATIFHYRADEQQLELEIYAEDGLVKIYFQGQTLIVNVTELALDGSHFVIVYSYENLHFDVYKDGQLYFQQKIGFSDVNDQGDNFATPTDVDDQGDNFATPTDIDDQGYFVTEIQSYTRDEPVYLFNNKDGNSPLPYSLRIAQFHLFGFQCSSTNVEILYRLNGLVFNASSSGRYLGSLRDVPIVGIVYDWFKYIGDTNELFLANQFYHRNITNGWDRFIPDFNLQ